mmetsp:Transcript_547/g.61  ORF Transcript_547/g.61 Transcript_547/m.61 type:complete len:81 (+) Transcript_547:822-1064(+)
MKLNQFVLFVMLNVWNVQVHQEIVLFVKVLWTLDMELLNVDVGKGFMMIVVFVKDVIINALLVKGLLTNVKFVEMVNKEY